MKYSHIMAMATKMLLASLLVLALFSCKKEQSDPLLSRASALEEEEEVETDHVVVQGRIYTAGSLPLTGAGFCWELKNSADIDPPMQFPTIDSDTLLMEGRVGLLKAEIEDLIPDTVYYVRIYVTNKSGVFYGYPSSFRTDPMEND